MASKDEIKSGDVELDVFFAAARMQDAELAQDTGPSSDLMARILADASQVQDGFVVESVKAPPHRVGFLATALSFFGGWPAVSALTACVCVGIFTGLSASDFVMGYVPGIEVQSDELGFGLFESFAEAELAVEG